MASNILQGYDEFILCVMVQIFAHEFGIETVKSRGDCRMRRKQICPSG